ncbi:MAG: HPr family phosphocarrier protein [Pseudomonadota bacterium]|nr:HPr family phosphocarrier protein [Pseudomonadota bacterium]|tara:strand:+ start:147 stop:419 length:273 start_codon:yes stop_codon:yes gene_type:complete
MSAVSRKIEILNQRGLHARAAAKFVKVAGAFEAKIGVCYGGAEVCGTSIMGLMMLAAGKGTVISICAAGADAEDAVEALAALVQNRFNED